MKPINRKCVCWENLTKTNDYMIVTFEGGRTFKVFEDCRSFELEPRILPFNLDTVNIDNIPKPFLPLGDAAIQETYNPKIGRWEY